uniref:Telomere-associated protein Rif1 N-terminal domain-containing protein n=1 Tax=Parascaris univalens TaxID=6257 RepID=A0A915CHR6_PARUN
GWWMSICGWVVDNSLFPTYSTIRMTSVSINTFLTSDRSQRTSLYQHLLSLLVKEEYNDIGLVVKLAIEDCVDEIELAKAAVGFMESLMASKDVATSHSLRSTILSASSITLSSVSCIFTQAQPKWKLNNIFALWSTLFIGSLKEVREVKTVINALCPPLKAAFTSKREVTAKGALGVWRSLISAFCDVVIVKTPPPFTERDLLHITDFILKPLKYMPDFCTEAKFETWVHLASCIEECSSECFQLVMIGLIRMSVGGVVQTVEPTLDVCDRVASAVTDDSLLLAEKCSSEMAQEWMQRKMKRHPTLAESSIRLIATLLDAHIFNGSFAEKRFGGIKMSLSYPSIPPNHSLMIAGCIRISSYYLEKDLGALSRVNMELEYIWAALCQIIVKKMSTTSERMFALKHTIAHFIAWVKDSQLSHHILIHAYLALCNGPYFPNGSSGYTISHAFVAIFHKVAADVDLTLWKRLCELTMEKVLSCSSAIRLRLLGIMIDGVLDSPLHLKDSVSLVSWTNIATVLTTHADMTQDLNEGSAIDVQYTTANKVLLFPLNAPCCAAELYKLDCAKQFTDIWKRLYTSIQAANAREASGFSFSYAVKVATVLTSTFENSEVNNEVLLTGSYLLRIVIETLPFGTLGESIFEACSDDPLEAICKMISSFGDTLLGRLNAKAFDEKSERDVESFRCTLGNLLLALEFAFKALSSTMHSLSLISNLSPFIGCLLSTSFDKANDAFFKSYRPKVQALLKIGCKSIESNYCGPYCSDLLARLEPLFIDGFRCSNALIRTVLADFWRKTFAKSTQLECSPVLREVLQSLRGRSRLIVPRLTVCGDEFHSSNQESTVFSFSQQATGESSEDLLNSQENVPLVKPLTPFKDKVSPERRKGHEESTFKRGRSDLQGEHEEFEVIRPQTSSKKMRLTERQKEKLIESREVIAYMNDDFSQGTSGAVRAALPPVYVIDSSQSGQCSSSSPDPELSPTQPPAMAETEKRAPMTQEKSPEVMEESPPRELPKTPHPICRSTDIRKYLSPSGSARRTPPKASSAPQKSLPRRLRLTTKRWSPQDGVPKSPITSTSKSRIVRRPLYSVTAKRKTNQLEEEIRKMAESIEAGEGLSQEIATDDDLTEVEEVADADEADTSTTEQTLVLDLELSYSPAAGSSVVVSDMNCYREKWFVINNLVPNYIQNQCMRLMFISAKCKGFLVCLIRSDWCLMRHGG